MSASSPLLSVVFGAYSLKQMGQILRLLDSLRLQTYNNLEILFVSDGSADLQAAVAELVSREAFPCTVRVLLNNTERGTSTTKNLGIRSSRGDIIAFIDADAVACPDWAEEVVNTFEDSSVIGVTGPALPLWEREGMGWFPEEFSWLWGGTSWYSNQEGQTSEIRNVGGMNCAFSREAFSKAGLFLPQLGPRGNQRDAKFHAGLGKYVWMGEEVEFSLRVRNATGKSIVFNPRVRVYHEVSQFKVSIPFIVQRAYLMGYARHFLKQMHPVTSFGPEFQMLWRIISRCLLRTMAQLPLHPKRGWRRLLVIITGVLFFCLGYLTYYFRPVRIDGTILRY